MRTLTQQIAHSAVDAIAQLPGSDNATAGARGPECRATAAPAVVETKPRTLRPRHCWRSSVWREHARSRLADLRVELNALPTALQSDARSKDARRRLKEAMRIVDARPRLQGLWTGVDVEGTWV